MTGQSPISGSGGSSSSFGYDSMGDLTSATSGSNTTSYSDDSITQMTSMTDPAGTTNYQYTGDGLQAGATSQSVPSWAAPVNVDGGKTIAIWSISCPSSSFCAAVDNNGNDLMYQNGIWSKGTIDPGYVDVVSVSCTSSSFCMAVDNEGKFMIYNPSNNPKWSSPAPITGDSYASTSVSCLNSAWCVVADTNGDIWWYNGTNWSLNQKVDPGKPLYSVSCSGVSSCAAVGLDGEGWIFVGGTTWWGMGNDGTELSSVSCTNVSACTAVDVTGHSYVWNGTSWTRYDVDGSTTLDSVSCTSATNCVAVASNGYELSGNPTTFSTTKRDIDGANEVTGVSFASPTFGIAVDNLGNTMVYSEPAATSEQLIWDSTASTPLVLGDGTNYYVYGETGEPVEQINLSTSTPLFLTYMPSDSAWLTTNAAGDGQAYWRYDAFGTLAAGTPDSPFGYAGQYTDTSSDSSGFDNMRARWYQAQTGQFTSVDPALDQTDQAFGYATDDPVNESDPSGLRVCVLGVCLGGGSVTTSVSLEFHWMAGLDAAVNIGRGASFGLSNDIANAISPGASCTVPGNSLDQFLGETGTNLVGGEILGEVLSGLSAAEEGAGEGTTYEEQLQQAQDDYPNKAGQTELHHVWPKYLGGDVNGETVPIDTAYHQEITNTFRAAWPYGQGPPPPGEAEAIMRAVYSQWPLP